MFRVSLDRDSKQVASCSPFPSESFEMLAVGTKSSVDGAVDADAASGRRMCALDFSVKTSGGVSSSLDGMMGSSLGLVGLDGDG